MRPTLIVTSLHVLFFCWLCGIELGLTQTNHEKTMREEPYRAVMLDDVKDLKSFGIEVKNPDELPPLLLCNACLQRREAFGAYAESLDGIVLPDNFDITTLEGRSILAHEYGHYLMTKAGVPPENQENICIALGNMVFQRFFKTASN